MQVQEKQPRRTIIQRLDAIEHARKAALTARYKSDYSDLNEADVSHLADLLASTRIRLIAETALSLLPERQVDEVLTRFE